jgi:predicted nucleic acid-binding protein
MTQLVIDSSVIVKWLNQQDEERLAQSDKVLRDAVEERVTLLAPELAKYEIGNTLLMKKQLETSDASITFKDLFIMPIQFVDLSEKLSKETYRIAKDLGITYYDACFIALAKQEEAKLITDNPKHQGRTQAITVIPLEEY